MREEYFMNFDFLRKFREKADTNGLAFRMLDFEDGGMYFGVVAEDLPSGLGAFVYSDLKFHCGVYQEGLMSGLSRIHFGNGDVYDGDTRDGKMEGKGFFFDCENNDWMFGSFEDDNCLEVIHRGEGFPKQQIIKYRANLHQQAGHFYNRATEQFKVDIDLLIELANRDLSHLKFEIDQAIQTPLKSAGRDEEEAAPESREELHEFYKKALDSQEHLKDMKKSQSSSQTVAKSKSQNIWRKKSRDPAEPGHLLLQDIHVIKPSVSDRDLSTKTKRKSAREGAKKSQGNQIVQDVQVLKPRQQKMLSVEVQTVSQDSEAPRPPPSVGPELQASHNSSMHNESRELRNISVQTEDDRHELSQHQEANLSYLKSIHTMIDELKTLLSKNQQQPPDDKLLEQALPFAGSLQTDDWNRQIDDQLQLQRQLELQQLMSQRFGAVEIEEVDFEHAANPLEPIKEIGEDEDEADPHPLMNHNESSIEKRPDDDAQKCTDDNFFPPQKPPAAANLLQIHLEVKETRESNFMHSLNVTMSIDRQKHAQWFMFNPYLYDVSEEVNTG